MIFHRIRLFILCILLVNSASQLEARFWHPVQDVHLGTNFSTIVTQDMNASNESVTVWYDQNTKSLYSSDYDYTTDSWSAQALITTTAAQEIVFPQVILDPAGTATVLWVEGDLNLDTLYSSQKTLGGTWTTPVIVANQGRPIPYAQMVRSANGDIVSAWIITLGSSNNVLYSSTLTGGAWSTPVFVSVPGENVDIDYALSVDNNGNALTIWTVYDTLADPRYLRASYKPVAGVWGAPQLLTSITLNYYVQSPAAVFDSLGNAYAIFSQSLDNRITFNTNTIELPFNGVWSVPQTQATYIGPNNTPENYKMGIDASNNVTTVWRVSNLVNSIIQSARKPFGQSWTVPETIAPASIYSDFAFGVDTVGNALLVYLEGLFPTTNVTGVYSPVGSSWQAPQIIASAPAVFPVNTGFSISPNGNALLSFITFDAISSTPVLSSLFADALIGPILPPTILSGTQRTNTFFTQSEYYNVLLWAAPASGPSAIAYNISRSTDGGPLEEIAVVPGNTLFYRDHNRKRKVAYTYNIVSVDAEGNTSVPAIITVSPK